MAECEDELLLTDEVWWLCQREEGHDGPHRAEDDRSFRMIRIEWDPYDG